MTTRKEKHAGFTLIEVMIASALMSFEILAVLTMFSISAKSSNFSRRLTGASSLAQAQLEKAKNTAYSNLTVSPPTGVAGTECFDKDLQSVACDGNETYTRLTTVTSNSPVAGMSRVEARVTWLDNKGMQHGTTLISSMSRF